MELLKEKVQEDDFLTAKGLGNEVPFWIFDYPPEKELLVRRTIDRIASNLINMSVNILVIDLYEMCLKLLEDKLSMEKIVQFEEERGSEQLLKKLKILLKNETIKFVAESNSFVPHFHIPLQSGSDTLLTSMKRRYQSSLYYDRVKTIKTAMPHACIGVDVIVGFPGESDELFLETYQMLSDLDSSYLHVFTYSERPNTEAIDMPDTVPLKVRNKRSKMLRGLSVKKRRAFYESQIGATLNVLFEGKNKKGYIHGFTQNYVKVKTPWNPELVNTLHPVKLSSIDEDGLVRFEWIKEKVFD